jgi:CO dehydrogenase/acetyl-CoA synthase beta subunit
MNRAFVREADGDEVVEPLYERQHSDLPNYITPEGLLHLKNRIRVLENSIEAVKEQQQEINTLSDRIAMLEGIPKVVNY